MINQEFLNELARDLPIIRPIKEFIHLNLLLPYQHLEFWDALKQVSSKLEAMPFAKMSFYREKIKNEEIPVRLIQSKLEALPSEINKESIAKYIFEDDVVVWHHDQRSGRLHEAWNELLDVNVNNLSDGMLIKWLSMFMDQGIGHWQMPYSEELSFYQCIRQLLKTSLILPDPFKRKDFELFFPENPEDAINSHLAYLCPEEGLRKEYCRESILNLRGWAGLIFTLQQTPELLSFRRKINLVDFLAIQLILERAWIVAENHFLLNPDFNQLISKKDHPLENESIFHAFKILQESMEEATYGRLLQTLQSNVPLKKPDALFQVVFCMDDRECSLRRHLGCRRQLGSVHPEGLVPNNARARL